jgi:hypothetical protein
MNWIAAAKNGGSLTDEMGFVRVPCPQRSSARSAGNASLHVPAWFALLALLLAPLIWLAATEPVAILADQERLPAFSW